MQELTKQIVDILADGYDHPEVWQTLRESARNDGGTALLPLIEYVHALLDVPQTEPLPLLLRVLRAVAVAQLGEHAVAQDELAELQVMHSQSALVAGAHFHVESLIHVDNPRYQLEGKVCIKPFQQLDVLENSTHQCCASWLQRSAGNLKNSTWREVWNSSAAQEIRASMLDGSYRYCNKSLCPSIQGNQLVPKDELRQRSEFWRRVVDEGTTELAAGPEVVNLAYDRTCNLSCPSCRKEKIAASSEERQVFFDMQTRNVLPMLKTAKSAFVTGSGDPFASKNFRQLLQSLNGHDYPALKLQIMTNGMLLTPEEWQKFPGIHGHVAKLKVSVDAATKGTHETLRRGAHWETMLANMAFMGELRAKGDVEFYELVFVVQQENFREMGDALDLARRVGADQLYFARISNWGTFGADEFRRKMVFAPSHPQYSEFLECMRDPRLRDPMVLMPDLFCFLPPAEDKFNAASAPEAHADAVAAGEPQAA